MITPHSNDSAGVPTNSLNSAVEMDVTKCTSFTTPDLMPNLQFPTHHAYVAIKSAAAAERTTLFVALLLVAILYLVFSTPRLAHPWSITTSTPQVNHELRKPSTVPYWIPVLGSCWSFLTNGPDFILNVAKEYGWIQPVHLHLGPFSMYLFTAPEHVTGILKASSGLDINFMLVKVLRDVLGMPKQNLVPYEKDDSGSLKTPNAGSNVLSSERVRHLNWNTAHLYLAGAHAPALTDTYNANLRDRLSIRGDIGRTWSDYPDLFALIQTEMLTSSVATFFGDYIFQSCPGLVDQLQDFHSTVHRYFRPYPSWMNRNINRDREVLLLNLQGYLESLDHEAPNHNTTLPSDQHRDPQFGSKFVKEIYRFNREIHGTSTKARASTVLGVIFGLTTNTIPAGFWAVLEIYRDPALLVRVRQTLLPFYDRETRALDPSFARSPLLQSIFHEVLRLHTHGILAMIAGEDYTLDGWFVPKGSMVGVSSTVAAHNPDHWNTGARGEWPVSEFWAERFLVEPGGRHGARPLGPEQRVKEKTEVSGERLQFTLRGLEGKFLSFGAGPMMCPGRHFAKGEVLTTLALFVLEFDIEMLKPRGWKPRPDVRFFPLGVLPPKDEVPFRIRRRAP